MLLDSYCNRVYFSAKLPEVCPAVYQGLTKILNRYQVPFGLLKGTRDIWCRDYMPLSDGHDYFLSYDYHPDYLMDTEKHRATITDAYEVCKSLGIVCKNTMKGLRLDGGNVISCGNKVILTAKVFEENSDSPARVVAQKLKDSLDAEPIFLPWDTLEIFGHADGICRYIGRDSVLMTNYADFDPKMAERFRKVLRSQFRNVYELHYEVSHPDKYNWAYINWLQTDKVIIVPALGTDEDEQALQQISEALPSYQGKIEKLEAKELIKLGGGFNCISWTIKSHKHYDIADLKNTSKSSGAPLEEAIFPCYGVKCVYGGRTVEYLYPDGLSDPFPNGWDDDEK